MKTAQENDGRQNGEHAPDVAGQIPSSVFPDPRAGEMPPKAGAIDPEDIIVVEDLVKIYNRRRVIDGISFRVRRGGGYKF